MVRFARSSSQLDEPLLRPLFDDMVECEELLEKATPGTLSFARRTYFRSFFAYLEGQVHFYRRSVLRWLASPALNHGSIPVTKLALLDEQSYRPDSVGKLDADVNRTPFVNHCALVLRCGSEIWGVDIDKRFSENGWRCLKAAVKVRHRLTHPKVPTDLEVTGDEIEELREAHTWFLNAVTAILNAAGQMMESSGTKP